MALSRGGSIGPAAATRALCRSVHLVSGHISRCYGDGILAREGAGHAFENPSNIPGYRPKTAADAWLRTLTFLNQSL